MSERRAATTIGELDIHLANVQSAMEAATEAIRQMATKEDLRPILDRLDSFATKAELAELRRSMNDESVSARFWGLLLGITRVGAALAVLVALGGMVAGIVHYFDTRAEMVVQRAAKP